MTIATFAFTRGDTLSLALEAVEGSITSATCEAVLKRAVNGLPPGDAAPVAATFVCVKSDDIGTGKPGWVLTINDSSDIPAAVYITDARIILSSGFVEQTDPVKIELRERVTA